jgi:hypothetical protein
MQWNGHVKQEEVISLKLPFPSAFSKTQELEFTFRPTPRKFTALSSI